MAQLVERMAVNHKVRGSNPRGGDTNFFIVFCIVKNGVYVGKSADIVAQASISP
jgi:hypothetical protein